MDVKNGVGLNERGGLCVGEVDEETEKRRCSRGRKEREELGKRIKKERRLESRNLKEEEETCFIGKRNTRRDLPSHPPDRAESTRA